MTAISSPISKFVEGVMYRGREGHWAYIFHRVSGLAILLFLAIHIVDTSWVAYAPELYEHAIELYRSLPFLISEYFLFAAIAYHAVNGVNIILKDTFPAWWNKHLQRNSFWKVIALSLLLWLPAAFFVTRNIVLYHFTPGYQGQGPVVAQPGLGIVYLIVPAVVIIVLAVLAYGGTFNQHALAKAPRFVSVPGKNFETWSWLFMRWSGGLLILVVFMHVLANALLTGAHYINLEYVAARWAQPLDWSATFILLMLSFAHGVNGLRAVLGDYLKSDAANRVAGVVLFVVWVVITGLGAYALFAGVRLS
ncbi:MAG: succinate dehydrogenase, cytochrome b556 subunit [Anaerolineales bacterium]|nr:succinate dehydrogenase, cytochrome b556 subunit [Anaerolineales bacterium]